MDQIMIAKVRTHGKTLDVSVDLNALAKKFSADPEVVRMWIADECVAKHGVDLDADDDILNLDVICNEVKQLMPKICQRSHPADLIYSRTIFS